MVVGLKQIFDYSVNIHDREYSKAILHIQVFVSKEISMCTVHKNHFKYLILLK